MGRVAAAGDNAAMESFYALLQKNVLDLGHWRTRDELRHAKLDPIGSLALLLLPGGSDVRGPPGIRSKRRWPVVGRMCRL